MDRVSDKCVEYLLSIWDRKCFSQQAYLTQGELEVYLITSGFQQSIWNHISPGLGGQAALVVTYFPIRDIQVNLRLKFYHNWILWSATALYSHLECWYITLNILTWQGRSWKTGQKMLWMFMYIIPCSYCTMHQPGDISIYIFTGDKMYVFIFASRNCWLSITW